MLCVECVCHEQIHISNLTVKSILVPMDVSVHLVLIHSPRLRLQSSEVVYLVSPNVIARKGRKDLREVR